MIDTGIDEQGASLRMLVAQALRAYPTIHLHTFLDDRSAIVRMAAARQLQIRGEAETFDHAMSLLSHRHAHMREIGVFLLGQLGTPSYPYKNASVRCIAERLSADRSSAVRAAAAAALGHLTATDELEGLVRAASDASAEVRACVAFALSRMKRRRRAREALRVLANDDSVQVRFWAGD